MKTIGFLLLISVLAPVALGADAPPPPPGAEITPPRLSFVDGGVSLQRRGAEDWAPARLNTPLAEGDALYTGGGANLEVQIGARAFARAAENTGLGIVSIEPNFLQLKVTLGQASLDLRSLAAAQTVELDTPHAVFTIEHPGYYRVAVLDDATHFITRRGGRATLTRADGTRQSVVAAEEIVVRADSVETYAAPEEPRAFTLGERRFEVADEIVDRWLAPEHRYFKVKADDGRVLLLPPCADTSSAKPRSSAPT